MPATPIIQKTGAVSGPSVGGQGSNDLVQSERVDLVDLEPANAASAYLWEFEDSPVGTSPTMNDPTTSTPHFFVDSDPALAGSYRVKCNVDGVEFSTEVFAKPLTNTGSRIPSFQEQEEFDEAGNPVGWHEAQTVFMRIVDDLLGAAQTSVTERQAAVVVPTGNSTKTVDLGGVVYPGSALAVSGKLEDAVTAGTIEIRLKVGGVTKLTAVLNTGASTFATDIAAAGLHPLLLGDLLTVEVEGIGYGNAGAAPSGLAISFAASNSLSNAPLSIPDSSNITKGITKLSLAPAIATEPVAVGTNDPRMPLQDENDALQGTAGVSSNANRFVTDSDSRNSDSRAPLGHTIGGAAHSASTLAQLNTKVSDATLIDTGDSRLSDDRDPNQHDLAGADHNSATLAQLNAKVSDATLIDTGDSRLSDSRAPSGSATGDLSGSYPNPTVDDGADGTALHDNQAGEIAAITEKNPAVGTDFVVIEDSAAANAKKRVQIANLGISGGGAGSDTTAIHDDTASEISAITEKALPVATDLLVIEDSAAANAKKRVQIGNLPSGASLPIEPIERCARFTAASNQKAFITDASQTGLDLINDFTVEGWLRLVTTGVDQTICGKWSNSAGQLNWRVYVDASDNVSVDISTNGTTIATYTGFSGTLVVWIHFAFTRNASTGELIAYKYGLAQTPSTLATGALHDGTLDFAVGANSNGTADLDGEVSSIRVWDRIRTPDEIKDNYRRTIPPDEENLQGLFPLDFIVASTTFRDRSPNGNDLTLTNTPTVVNEIPYGGLATKIQDINVAGPNTKSTNSVAYLDEVQSYSKQQHSAIDVLTDAATTLIDAEDSNIYALTATGAVGNTRQLDNPTSLVAGMAWVVIFNQDATGGRDLTFDTFYDFGDEGVPDFTAQGSAETNTIYCLAITTTQILCSVKKGYT